MLPLQQPRKYGRSTDFPPYPSQQRCQEHYKNRPQEMRPQCDYFAAGSTPELCIPQFFAPSTGPNPQQTGYSPFSVVPQPTSVASRISAARPDQSLLKSGTNSSRKDIRPSSSYGSDICYRQFCFLGTGLANGTCEDRVCQRPGGSQMEAEQLVILCLHLEWSSCNDGDIYFLAWHFDKRQYLQMIAFLVQPHPASLPETILQIAEGNSTAEYVPRRFRKIGTILSKASEARIFPSFVFANAYNSERSDPEDPVLMNVDLPKADNPELLEPVVESEMVLMPAGGLKRKREEVVPGSEDPGKDTGLR
ncbi:hypothetical protein K438DRAFT_1753369 [Mycena galopus ATCC 62051]|nr:hypothetical protein K438DRAFT_1753369 [Mycena galopus ATCC 62051]